MKGRSIVWTEKANSSLDFICEYISKESRPAARKVRAEVMKAAGQLSKTPEMYQVDEYLTDLSPTVRRFFRWSYRIVYQVYEKEIVILAIFHTSLGSSEEE